MRTGLHYPPNLLPVKVNGLEIKSVWWQQLMLGKIWAAIAILNISAWSLSDKKTPTLSWAV
ncbi:MULTISPECIES: hypothetical protein [unclassified Gilliamella]|uniref:hypothetical protein n=1 Tax=unclassified Gilliamella TaxID=2685620 RepID=UPI002269ACE8|nr:MULTISPECIES: hypothetical protein [unclassified Gilliamella]MCX8607177.1 hypothetical protein [Gilliamella sp. B3771]MCX8614909.1 hypothetical protein [Gilliamella sp. B3770]MCX8626710.1 hypothetical protein [Gilliamella sp. B3976]